MAKIWTGCNIISLNEEVDNGSMLGQVMTDPLINNPYLGHGLVVNQLIK